MSEERRWFEHRRDFVAQAPPKEAAPTEDTGPDLFTKCPSCAELLYNDKLAENLNVCPMCGHHMRIGAIERLRALCDAGSVTLHDTRLHPVDALQFTDSKPYSQRIEASRRKTGRNDALVAVSAEIIGVPVEIGCFDFAYMGGSMGSVVGEQITRIYERATERGVPAIIVSASGGARMQEGVLSLMQMAKTCAALSRLRDHAQMPYISVLTHPTTGGVAASFAMLGDIILSEPEALVGFAGPRVIRETIGEELPDGFQTAEYLLAHGMIDHIVDRLDLRSLIAQLLRQLLGQPAHCDDIPPSLHETLVEQAAEELPA